MLRAHRNTLSRNRFHLGKDLVVDNDFLHYLVQTGVLTESQKEEIDAQTLRSHRSSFLLDILPKRGVQAFGLFIDALVETGQGHLASRLDPSRGDAINQPRKQKCSLQRQISQPSDSSAIEIDKDTAMGVASPEPSYSSASAESKEKNEKGVIDKNEKSSMPQHQGEGNPAKQLNKGVLVSQPQDEKLSVHHYQGQDNAAKQLRLDTSENLLNIEVKNRSKECSPLVIGERVYEMSGEHQALILHAKDTCRAFDEVNITQLLEALNCTVTAADDKDSFQKTLDYLRETVKRKDMKDCDSLLCVIFMKASFENIDVRELYHILDEKNCPDLARKPKVVILHDSSSDTLSTEKSKDILDAGKESFETDITEFQARIQKLSLEGPAEQPDDFLLVYATYRDNTSLDTSASSFFVLALAKVFMECACCMEITDLFDEVHDLIRRTESINQKGFNMSIESSLTKAMFLPPAFSST